MKVCLDILLWLALAGGVLTGCSRVTTVKVSTPPYGPEPASAYSERREERVLVTFNQEPKAKQTAQQAPDAPGSLKRPPEVSPEVSFASDTSAPAPAPPGSAPIALSLFGELPGVEQAGTPDGAAENLRRITFTSEGDDFDPAVDPTGSFIVYASTRHRQTADLYLARIGQSAVTQLTSDAGNDVMPAISPDGKRIAFCSDRSGNWDIYILDTTAGGAAGAVQLTSDPGHELHPSFSPDGKSLVYCSYSGRSGQWELVVIDLAQPATKRFIGYGLFPNWSPTDNRIVFQRARERGSKWFSIWTLEYQDGEALRPTEVAVSSNAACITPDWSPDGRHIVFCTVVDPQSGDSASPKQADVWVVGADGTGRVNLTRSPHANLQPVWANDGSIYFVSNRGQSGSDNIWAVNTQRALSVAASPGAAPTQPAAATAEVPINQD